MKILNTINKNGYILLGGDFNARVRNLPVPNVVGAEQDVQLNNNGNQMYGFCVCNTLKITNTFF